MIHTVWYPCAIMQNMSTLGIMIIQWSVLLRTNVVNDKLNKKWHKISNPNDATGGLESQRGQLCSLRKKWCFRYCIQLLPCDISQSRLTVRLYCICEEGSSRCSRVLRWMTWDAVYVVAGFTCLRWNRCEPSQCLAGKPKEKKKNGKRPIWINRFRRRWLK